MELIATQTLMHFTEHIYKNEEGNYYRRNMLTDSIDEIQESEIADMIDIEWSVDSIRDYVDEFGDGKYLCKKYIPIYDYNTTVSLYGFGNTKEEASTNCNESYKFFLRKLKKD